jgi:phosphatidylserine/phosphatidylglycerophosphate/cardiolipin synthase-like enzyme
VATASHTMDCATIETEHNLSALSESRIANKSETRSSRAGQGCVRSPKMKYVCLLLLGLLPGCEPYREPGNVPAGWEVYFSPRGGCTEAIVRALDCATNSVIVQAYSFTSAPIAKAIVEAHRRRVQVAVLLDKSQRTEKYSSADFLNNAGVATFIDARHGIAHNKVMVIDGRLVLTGSFNFTKGAEENNAENLLVINDPPLAARYTANWKTHLQHSQPYERRSSSTE